MDDGRRNPMLKEKQLMDKLYELPVNFKFYMEKKDYPRAKSCYDTARTIALFLELDEKQLKELFGERGERGIIIQQGLFPEESVQRAYIECIRRNQTNENRRYEPIQKNSA